MSGILYAGAASGGLWKSTDEGKSWVSIFDDAGQSVPPAMVSVICETPSGRIGCCSQTSIAVTQLADGVPMTSTTERPDTAAGQPGGAG